MNLLGPPGASKIALAEYPWVFLNTPEYSWAPLSTLELSKAFPELAKRETSCLCSVSTLHHQILWSKIAHLLWKVRILPKNSRTGAIFKENAKTARAVCEKQIFPKHSEVGIMHLYDVFTIHPRISWPKSTYLRRKIRILKKKYKDWCDFQWKQQHRSNFLREITFCLSTRISKHCACATFLRCALEFSFARPKIAYLRRKNAISEKALEACSVFQWKQQNRSNCMRKYTSKHCCGIPRPLPEHSQSTPRKVSEHCQKSCNQEIRATEEKSIDR